MIKKTLKNTSLVLALLVLFSCSSNSNKIESVINQLDESEIAAVQQQKALKNATQTKTDSITSLSNKIAQQANDDSINDDSENSSGNMKMPKFMHFLFPLIIVGFFIYSGYRMIKKAKNKITDISHSAGVMKDALKNAKEMVENEPEDGRKITDEEKAGLEFLDKHLNKK